MSAAFPRWGAIAGLTHHFGKTIFGMTKPACGGKHANAACVGLSSDAPLCRDCAAMAGISIAAPLAENVRILISRNKREGGYCGWRAFGPRKRDCITAAGHVRAGANPFNKSMRQWSRA